MTAPDFAELVREVIAGAEVQGALLQMAVDGDTALPSLEQELAAHLSDRRGDCYKLAAAEAARHQEAVEALEALLRQHGLWPEESPALRDARDAAATAREAVERSFQNLREVLAERTREMTRIEQAKFQQLLQASEPPEPSATAAPSARPGLFSRARRPTAAAPAGEDFGAQRLAIAQKVEQTQQRHQALTNHAAAITGNFRQLEMRAAREISERLTRRSPDEPAEVTAARERMASAAVALRVALVEKAVLPLAREWLTGALAENRRHRYRLVFDTQDTDGLRQMSAPEHELPTVAFRRLAAIMEQVGGGAIGISGPRGVGKSTLMRSVSRNPDWLSGPAPTVGVVVPAPVVYVPREFILHVHATLCRRVLHDYRAAESASPVETERPGRADLVLQGLSAALVTGGLLAAGAVAATGAPGAYEVLTVALLVATVCLCAHDADRARLRPARLGWSSPAVVVALVLRAPYRVVAVLGLAGAGILVRHAAAAGAVEARAVAHGAAVVAAVVAVTVLVPSGRTAGLAPLAGAGLTLVLLVVEHDLLGAGPVAHAWAVIAFSLAWLAMRGGPQSSWPGAPTGSPIPGLADVSVRVGAAITGTAVWLVVAPVVGWAVTLPGAAAAGLAAAGVAIAAARRRPPARVPQHGGVPTTRLREPEPLEPGYGVPDLRAESADALVRKSQDALRRIQYQQTITRGWSEAVKLGAVAQGPLSVEMGATGGSSLARVALTFPEVVADFHDYVSDLVRHGHRVIVGIDELDKQSGELASQFLNDLKAIFDGNVPGCYFLVSVSEEALASFQQRGLPTRDVFDTAFDEMLAVDYLGYEATVAMLGRRVIDLPRGVVVLCHALSGGLPRDVVRMMRMADGVRGDREVVPLAEIASEVCFLELRNRIHGLQTALRDVSSWRAVVAVQEWAATLRPDDLGSLEVAPPLAEDRDDDTARELVQLHAASFYHLATVRDVLVSADEDDVAALEDSGVDELARARQALTTSWAMSVQRVSAFRRARGLRVPSLRNLGIEEAAAAATWDRAS